MTVYLGAPDPAWIGYANRPLCVSHVRLRTRTTSGLPIAPPGGPGWILDSGAYSMVTQHGRHLDTPEQYVAAVQRYDARIGGLRWASIQDWMCEHHALKATGLTVEAHQLLTLQSYVDLTELWNSRPRHRSSPFKLALQGDKPRDYVRMCRMCADHGVDLAAADIVGLGSVCGRESTQEIAEVVAAVRAEVPGIRLHGYGVKTGGLALYGAELASVDSQACFEAARKRNIKSPRCTAWHKRCTYCLVWGEEWHDKVTAEFNAARRRAHSRPVDQAGGQLALFGTGDRP